MSVSSNQWTTREVNFLSRFYRNTAASVIARQLGRTESAVTTKASKLYIPSWKSNPYLTTNRGNRSSVSF